MWWQEMLTVLAMVLIVEGIVPVANPQWMRRMWQLMLSKGDAALRAAGVLSMLSGLLILYLVP